MNASGRLVDPTRSAPDPDPVPAAEPRHQRRRDDHRRRAPARELRPRQLRAASISCGSFADGVATITLNRPERKNPLTFESYAELRDTFRALNDAAEVKAVVLTGAGGNFCSGGDVHEIIGPLTKMDAHGLLQLHPHDRRPGQGDARLPAADRRRGRRRLRRRRRDHGDGQRPAARRARRRRPPSCSPASACPARTWAPARSCRASSATAAPPSCCSPAAA